MINLARQALCNAGLIESDCEVQSFITVGRSLNVQVFPDGSSEFYNVKLSHLNLGREYRALRELQGAMGRAVPTPLAFMRVNGMDALVTRGVRFKCVRGSPPSLSAFIQGYHDTQLQSPAFAAPTLNHRHSIRKMLKCVALKDLEDHVVAWLASAASDFLEGLPPIRQHGDLVPMNLGTARDGYVVFDWEDFGIVALPGFDLGIFLLDAAGFDAAGLESVLAPRDRQVAALRECLITTLKLKERDFSQLVFASLVAYLFLKSSMHYRAPIIEATKKLILAFLYGTR